jgi:predicted CoA-binding protein
MTSKELLEKARVIAVVGCSDHPWRDSNRIFHFLKQQGYTVYPVNPTIDSVDGIKTWPDVQSIPEKVDIVDIFRRPEFVPDVVEDAIAAGAGAVWTQLGASNPAAERRAAEAGLAVVADRCIAVDYRLLGVVRAAA